jgi:hypothetical protein
MEEFRQWRRKSQENFDPFHMKEPRPPSAKHRKAIEALSSDALHGSTVAEDVGLRRA